PGLLAEVIQSKVLDLPKPKITIAEKIVQAPPPTVSITSPRQGQSFTQRQIEVTVECRDNGGGIEDVRLYHNDKLVSEDTRGIKIASTDFIKSFQVSLLMGENRLRATAFSTGRVEAAPYEIVITLKGIEAEAVSHLFVLGIDGYKNSKYNLNFAKADASSIRSIITEKSRTIFKDVQIHELYDSEATGNNIRTTFEEVIRLSNPQDVFTFFYAGHGVMIPDADGREQFFLAPTEVTSLYNEEKMNHSGISASQLVDYSRRITARKQLFIIDACQAGSISDAFALRGAAEEKALAQLARSAGVHVIASTGSEQFATEFKELGHGLFTHALIQAIQGAADGSPKDGRITVREINAYLENIIPDLSEKYKGQPQFPVIFSKGQDFPVAVE
ncbi:caspase family protein, partial [bacterium]